MNPFLSLFTIYAYLKNRLTLETLAQVRYYIYRDIGLYRTLCISLLERACTYAQVRYYRDTYAEHPEDRKNIEYSVHLDNDGDLVTLR